MIYTFILEKFLLPLSDFVLGTCYMKHLRYWRKVCHLDESQLTKLQSDNLSKMLSYVVENVPYYQTKALNSKDHEDVFAYLKSFPVLSKRDINHHNNELISRKAKSKTKIFTGGSTGYVGVFYTDKSSVSLVNAIQTVWWEWTGYRLGDRLIQTGITVNRGVVKFFKDIFLRVTYVSAFNLTDKQIYNILKAKHKGEHVCLGGYASSLRVFAEVALRHDMNVRFKTAISWGDKLFESYKSKIGKAFGCQVFETYGCSEGIMIGSKKDLDYFYLMTPHVVVEILDENNNEVPDGKMGYVVLTCLTNYTMPIIRYRIGDLAIKLPRHDYPEQRDFQFPLLKRVIGRNTDVIRTPSGNFLVVQVVEALFEEVEEILQFKLIQHSISLLEVQYVALEPLDGDLIKQIDDRLRQSLHDPFEIRWSLVPNIAPTPSGKPQFIESRIINVY